MQVIHNTFGTGTIISQDANNVTIDFAGTVKTLVTKYCKLTNEDGTPFSVEAVSYQKATIAATLVKATKKTKAMKRMEWERTLTEDQKRELRFENADGSFNQAAYEKFQDEQEKKKWACKSW